MPPSLLTFFVCFPGKRKPSVLNFFEECGPISKQRQGPRLTDCTTLLRQILRMHR